MLDTNPRSRICVFCASSHGSHPEYAEQARELGQALATRGYGLVYGGGTLGLMGEVARAADEHGGDVLGIIPQALIPAEAQGNVIGRVIEVQDMHERKRAMNAKADAFFILPGGYGTMEELLEMTTWSMINIHAKPIVLINIRGYFDPLIQWTHLAAKEGFLREGNQHIMVSANSVDEAFTLLQNYTPPAARYTYLTWPKSDTDDELS